MPGATVTRVRHQLSRRGRRLWRSGVPIVQCAVAAGLAWAVAVYVIGHPQPFFAPIAAVISLNVSLGQRLRRVIELIVGVSVGIGVADLLISAIGTGPWQIALVVALAMSTAVLLDSGAVIVIQAASSAVLVATLLPPYTDGGLGRMIDAAVGGLVGFTVAVLLPANPLTVAHRNGRVVLGALADALRGAAGAVSQQDAPRAAEVLTQARESQRAVNEFRTALDAGIEIARFAPLRWHRRHDLERYSTAAIPVDRALRNTRVLTRRALTALREDEPVPRRLPELLQQLAGAVTLLRDELAAGVEPVRARDAAKTVAQHATIELAGERDFSMRVVVAQLRSVAVDLLQATGLSRDEANAALPPTHPDDDQDRTHEDDRANENDRAEGADQADGADRKLGEQGEWR